MSSYSDTFSDALLRDARQLHPGLRFCGYPEHDLSLVSEDLLRYVAALLRDQPIRPPDASPEQWGKLLHSLKPHWILPFLYYKIRCLPEAFFPPEPILRQLQFAFLQSHGRIVLLEEQLQDIVENFGKAGVRVLVMKGPAYAHTIYPNVAVRPCSDLDLLVEPERVPQARAILEYMNYTCLDRKYDIAKHFYCEERFLCKTNDRKRLMIELHWYLYPVFRPQTEETVRELVERTVGVQASGVRFETMNPIDALIHRSLVNWAHHDIDMRFIWICDVALLARKLKEPEDWKILQERSVLWRARLAVELSLLMACACAGLQLPKGFENFSTWPAPSAEERDIWIKVIRRHTDLSSHLREYFGRYESMGELLQRIFRLLFPHPALMRQSYAEAMDRGLIGTYIHRWRQWISRIGMR